MARPKLKDKELDELLKNESALLDEIEMFYSCGMDEKLYNHLFNIYKGNLPNKLSYELGKNTHDFFDKYKIKSAQQIILFESSEVFCKREFYNEKSCWAKKLSFGDTILVYDDELLGLAEQKRMSKEELVEFLKSYDFEHYSANAFKARENRLHFFRSVQDAAKWVYEQTNNRDYNDLPETEKLVADYTIKDIIKPKITRALTNKTSYLGYIPVKIGDIN